MTLGDLFDRWFKLIASTWLRNLIVSTLLLGPAAIVFAIAIENGFDQILQFAERTGGEFDRETVSSIVGFFVWFFFGIVILLAGTVTATVGVTITGCSEMSSKTVSWQEALRSTLSIRLLKVFGQYILEFVGLGLIVAIPYALIVAAIAAESILLGLLGGVLIFIAIAGAVYLVVSFAFTVPAIAWENCDIIEAFRRSWTLVRGHWWRTFGILLLMSLIVSFAVSLLMTPLYLVVLWDFFRSYFEMLSSLGSGEPDAELVRTMLSSFGFGFGIVNAIAAIAQVIVAPLYTVVLYFDLRARRGEFNQAAQGQV
jgi:hypothetical protein